MLPYSKTVVNIVFTASSEFRPREAVEFGNFARNELLELFAGGDYFSLDTVSSPYLIKFQRDGECRSPQGTSQRSSQGEV